MKRRTAFVRILTLLCAALQLASPAFSAVAHGKLASDNASGPAMHVEATTTASCPVVHAPDCAVCRYLTTPAAGPPDPAVVSDRECEASPPKAVVWGTRSAPHALPPGRAPPTA